MRRLSLVFVFFLASVGAAQAQKYPVQFVCDSTGALAKKACNVTKQAMKKSPSWSLKKNGPRYGVVMISRESIDKVDVAVSASFTVVTADPFTEDFPYYIGLTGTVVESNRINDLGPAIVAVLDEAHAIFESGVNDPGGAIVPDYLKFFHLGLGPESSTDP